ncbi:MAG: YraN family protein [Holosporaceae bacterium]|jgi:putative endonuclease|nr:YraN family protein [Holosporaceae bacterium]
MNPTEKKGRLGEFIAALLLKIKGYKILARRYKTPCGEIDIIAQKDNIIAFIEVKSRKTIEKCHNAVAQKQLKRIQRASEIFLERHRNLCQNFRRYDVVLVADWKFPTHIKNISI